MDLVGIGILAVGVLFACAKVWAHLRLRRLMAEESWPTFIDRQKARYVRGEIDLERFEWLVKMDLEDPGSQGPRPRFPDVGLDLSVPASRLEYIDARISDSERR